MAPVGKFFMFFILLEVLVFIYLYVTLGNSSFTVSKSESSKVKERNSGPIDTNMTDNETSRSNKKREEQFFGQQVTAVDHLSNDTVIPNMTVHKEYTKQHIRFKHLRFLKLNERIPTSRSHTHNQSYIPEKKSKCTISFDSDSLISAKEKNLTSKYYLFYVHLEIDGFQILPNEERDDLLHWQYVLKTEKLLVQLPVDFDLLTYKLLANDNEETTIDIKLVYNHSDCIQKDFSEILLSVRLLLWNNLFDNNTDYYLCNRQYKNEFCRNFMYYITTIWVGYDLTCSEMSSKHGLLVFEAEKDHVPLVAPIFCFLLSLQFVWIFVLLDMQKYLKSIGLDTEDKITTAEENGTQYPKKTKSTQAPGPPEHKSTQTHTTDNIASVKLNIFEENRTEEKSTQSPEPTEDKSTQIPDLCTTDNNEMIKDNGTQTPKPERVLVKLKNITEEKGTQAPGATEDKCTQILPTDTADNTDLTEDDGTHTPKTETVKPCFYKKKMTNEKSTQAPETDKNEMVLCPEFRPKHQCHIYSKNDRPYGIKRLVVTLFFKQCCFCKHCCLHNPAVRLLFLLWFFILFPFGLYRTIGRYCILMDIYKDYFIVVRTSEPLLSRMSESAEGFIVALDALYAVVFPFVYIFVGSISYQRFLTSDQRICCYDSEDKDQTFITTNKPLSDIFTFRFYQFCKTMNKLCFPRGCCKDHEMCYEKSKKCGCNWIKYVLFCKCPCLFCYCIFPIIPFSCNTRKCIEDCSLRDYSNRTKTTEKKWCKPSILILINLFCLHLPMSYIVCLRPIISTFTFLFRSFTNLVFVALPIRVHILRLTILIVTTVTYFIQYFHEIVNMNAEILNYIFTCEKKRKHEDVKYIEERMFDYIYRRILFVKKNLYILVLKMMIVFMYLFITIETFITNQTSLTGTTFKDMLEFLLIIIGPYAIALFLKANKDDFLTDDNKVEIEKKYRAFLNNGLREIIVNNECNQNNCKSLKENQDVIPSETPSGSGNNKKSNDIELDCMVNASLDLEACETISKETDPLIPKKQKTHLKAKN